MSASEKLQDLHPLLTGPPVQELRDDLWDRIIAVVDGLERIRDLTKPHPSQGVIYAISDVVLTELEKALP